MSQEITNTFTIELPPEQVGKLLELARSAGVTPEELLRVGVEQWLALRESDFTRVADYVLKKNAELYRKLA